MGFDEIYKTLKTQKFALSFWGPLEMRVTCSLGLFSDYKVL
jgi:hypothetical protein